MFGIPYQAHARGERSQVDNFRKLDRLKIPDSLQGKKVLDIGCNEGFFCKQTLDRGAASVVGIDYDPNCISKAKEIYKDPSIEFICGTWDTLPEGEFDLILWTSAMHYELDPLKVFKDISQLIAPDGIFILECGVSADNTKEMARVTRHDGSLWYPTRSYLEFCLDSVGLAFREVSPAEHTGTDPVPRYVFHVKKIKTNVIALVGKSNIGKSFLSFQIAKAADKIISLDWFIARIYHAKYVKTEFEHFIKNNTDPANLKNTYDLIDESGYTEDYVSELSKAVAFNDKLVIFEGYMTEPQISKLREELSSKAKFWVARNE